MSKQKLLVFGDDNGFCSLYAMSLAEYNEIRDRADEAEANGGEFDEVFKEAEDKKINITTMEHGYVPDYVVQLSKIYGFDVESN